MLRLHCRWWERVNTSSSSGVHLDIAPRHVLLGVTSQHARGSARLDSAQVELDQVRMVPHRTSSSCCSSVARSHTLGAEVYARAGRTRRSSGIEKDFTPVAQNVLQFQSVGTETATSGVTAAVGLPLQPMATTAGDVDGDGPSPPSEPAEEEEEEEDDDDGDDE